MRYIKLINLITHYCNPKKNSQIKVYKKKNTKLIENKT